ncbi:SRPBCC family protein [Cochleicola gelatinilyticus]|uniref:ATPase n=1 Tax=Cochleicola gelatinilyticus TaxID=1763537 RepID=A0A167J966_9FLAO|nr:hypothetical protein [Cochleicola gelatinilyticus]OAB80447.1 hypothetical protein ULVI_06855 [Cochleicola gelatinilyticus]
MKRKEFSIQINAPKKKVWNVLWNCETYTKWAAPFCEGSKVETSWDEGDTAKFLGPNNNGLLSRIEKNKPHDFIAFKHEAVIENNVVKKDTPEAKEWIGAVENYTLKGNNGNTTLLVETDIPKRYVETFTEVWPKALQRVKELSETA